MTIAIERQAGPLAPVRLIKSYPMELILLVLVVFLIWTAPGFRNARKRSQRAAHWVYVGNHRLRDDRGYHLGRDRLSVGAGAALAGCIVAWFAGAARRYAGLHGRYLPRHTDGRDDRLRYRRPDRQGPGSGSTSRPSSPHLALFTALRGVANLITGGFPLATFPAGFEYFGGGYLSASRFPVYMFAADLRRHAFPDELHALRPCHLCRRRQHGSGPLVGYRHLVGQVRSRSASDGRLTAVSGTLIASQIGSGTGTTATGMELDVIAAVIIGGTSLFGGKGRIWGTLIGVLFLGCISNGMTLLNVSEYWQIRRARRDHPWRRPARIKF